MNAKQLLLKCITLLYREHQREKNTDHSADTVTEALKTIRLPEVAIDNDRTHHIIAGLRNLLEKMCEQPLDEPFELSDLRQQVRVIVEDEVTLYDAFNETVTDEPKDQKALKRTCVRYKHQVNEYLREHQIREVLTEAGKTAFRGSGNNLKEKAVELIESLEPLVADGGDAKDPNIVDEVDFTDLDAIKRVFALAKEEESPDGIMQTGLQGINRMCGPERLGLRRGEFITWGGLQHNFKSGFGLMILAQIALMNTPIATDPDHRPLLLLITAENELQQNLTWLYKYIRENEEGVEIDLTKCSIEEMSDYIQRKMLERGWYFYVMRIDPSDFTYRDIYTQVQRLEAKGYEIFFCLVDYLNMISKRGCTQPSGTGSDVRDLFRRVRNFMTRKRITFATPHQLSTEAKKLLREGPTNFVKEVANKGYWDSCKTIDNEMDLELYIHIVKAYGKSYLTIQRGKHRKTGITPEIDLYCVYEFSDIGTIKMDVGGEDQSLRKVGGKPESDGGGDDWFATGE